MEELSDEGRALYDLLKGTIVDDVDKRLRDQKDAMVGAVRKMIAENTAQLTSLTEKMEMVRDEIGIEISQIRLDLDKGKQPEEKATENLQSPSPLLKETANLTPPGFGFRDKASGTYVPPPI